MTWQELLDQRRVAREPTGRDEVAALRRLVSRCLANASIETLSPDGRFERACAAAQTLATIVIRVEGYRVRQPGAHYSTFLALEAADPEAFASFASYFDLCRTLRNELSYNGGRGHRNGTRRAAFPRLGVRTSRDEVDRRTAS